MDMMLLLAVSLLAVVAPDIPQPGLPTIAQVRSCAPGLELKAAAICLNQQALDQEKLGDFAAASKTFEQANRLWENDAKPEAALHATLLSNLGETYEQLGRWREARECFQRALALSDQDAGKASLGSASSMVRLASAEMLLGNPARSEELLNTALPIERRALPGSALELAGALIYLSNLELQKGDIGMAVKLAQEGVEVSGSRSRETPDYAASLTTLAGAYMIDRDLTRATPLLNRAIDILERSLGPDHPRLVPMLMDRAMIYQGEQKTSLAEADARRAVAILGHESGRGNINTAWAEARLSGIYLDEGKMQEADDILPPAVDLQRRFYDHPNWRMAASIGELGRLRAAQSRNGEAEALYRESLAMFDTAAPNNPEAARAMRGYADLLRTAGGSKREIRRLMARARSLLSSSDLVTR